MAFMADHKEVATKTTEAMEQRFRPIAPKPMLAPPPPPPTPIGATVSSIQWRAQKRSRQDYPVPSLVLKRERDMMSYSSPPAWWGTNDVEVPVISFASSSAPLRDAERSLLPIERDLISKLQVPKVIKPIPTRPKRTTIYIDCSNIIDSTNWSMVVSKKTPREVEAEMELPGALPAIVSGCNNNRVHLLNDAYNNMVGQPLCPWLRSLLGTGASRRINGEVVLFVQTFTAVSSLPEGTRCAFPCIAKISWQHEDTTASLIVPCGVEHLTRNSKDYCFIWRFDSKRASILYDIA